MQIRYTISHDDTHECVGDYLTRAQALAELSLPHVRPHELYVTAWSEDGQPDALIEYQINGEEFLASNGDPVL